MLLFFCKGATDRRSVRLQNNLVKNNRLNLAGSNGGYFCGLNYNAFHASNPNYKAQRKEILLRLNLQ
jgi:hypothetical protein